MGKKVPKSEKVIPKGGKRGHRMEQGVEASN